MPYKLVETRSWLLKSFSGFVTDEETANATSHSQAFPRRLGEALLLIYFALGVCTAYAFRSGLAFFSSGALFAAVVIVVYLRWNYGPHNEAKGNEAAAEESEDEALMARVWSKSHECEHEIIDTQHRDLYSAFHALCHAARDKQAERFDALLLKFIDKLRAHFSAEEAVLRKCDPSIASAHAQEHQLVLSRAVSLSDEYQQGKLRRAALTNSLMNEVLVNHIEEERRAIRRAFWG